MLLPRGAPPPSAEVRAKFPPQFDFQSDGVRIAGSPIGTDDFMRVFVDDKISDAQHKIGSIKFLGRKSPRAAHRLLTCCASKLMCYLSTTVPPHIMLPALHTFDVLIESAFFRNLVTHTTHLLRRQDVPGQTQVIPTNPGGMRSVQSLRTGDFRMVVICLLLP